MKLWSNVKKWLPGVLIVVLLCGLIGSAYAKYVTDIQLGPNTVTINASLGNIELLEHKAVRLANGDYDLLDDTVDTEQHQHVTANAYTLLPGLDIPKDPFVLITDKTTIPVYVFVEVVSALNGSAVTYEVDTDNWERLTTTDENGNTTDVIGANGGAVYVYKDPVTTNIGPIYILKNNKVIVSQKLNADGKKVTGLGLTFYASMYEVASGSDAASVYTNNTKNTNP